MKRFLVYFTIAFVLIVLAVTPASTATTSPGNYADYTMMFTSGSTNPGGQAGQLWTSTADSQFAWTVKDPATADVLWGTPASWPVGTFEHFSVSSGWVELSGYSNTNDGLHSNGQDYTQTVDTQSLGMGNCSEMLPIPVHNGHELYAMAVVPVSTYCLDAHGTIAGTIHFEHWTQWTQGSCSNAYYTGDQCIFQTEKWWDDNGHPYALQIDRTTAIAKGKGFYQVVNRVVNGSPNTTVLNLRYYWSW